MSYLREHPELLASFRAGDKSAQEQVFRSYVFLLDRVLRRGYTVPSTGLRVPPIRQRSERADVIQETFVRAFQPEVILAYDGVRDYLPWLVAIAFNVHVSQHRRHGRELPSGARDSWTDGQVAVVVENDEPEHDPGEIAIMHQYLATLPEPMRAVHQLRHVERVSRENTAARLGITTWRVLAIETKLRKQLFALLRKAGLRD